MEFKEFSDLTNFIYDEYAKMAENFVIQQPSTEFIKYTEETLMSYVKVYNKPFYKEQQRRAKLMEALNTRPHGWIWKLFHSSLWAKIKEIEKEEKINKERRDKLAELDYERIKKELQETQKSEPSSAVVLAPTWIGSTEAAITESEE